MAQIIAVLIALLLVLIALKDKAHAFGVWLAILMSHGVIVHYLGPGATNLPLFVGLALVPFLLWNKNGFYLDALPLFLLGLFLTVGAFSALVNGGDFGAIKKLTVYGKPILLCVLIMGGIEDRRTFLVIAGYIIASGVFGGLFNAYQQVLGMQLAQSWDPSLSRAAGLRGDPNDTAMLLLLTLPLAYVWLINAQGLRRKAPAAASLLIIAAGVILTGSRAAFLVLAIVGLLLTFHQAHLRARRVFALPGPKKLITAALVVAAAALTAPGYYWERVGTLVTGVEVGGAESLYGRQQLLKSSFDVWLNHPLLGIGPGEFRRTAGNVAHNMYLEFLAEFGFIGAMAVFGIFCIAMVRLAKLDTRFARSAGETRHLGFGYAVGLFAMLMMANTLSQGYNSVFWFVIGLGLAAKRHSSGVGRGQRAPGLLLERSRTMGSDRRFVEPEFSDPGTRIC